MKRSIILALLGLVIIVSTVIRVSAQSPNYGSAYYAGSSGYSTYIQIQPSYNQNGNHAARGTVRVVTQQYGEIGSSSTPWGANQNDTRILSANRMIPSPPQINPYAFTAPTQFVWVPHDSGHWPVSVGLESATH